MSTPTPATSQTSGKPSITVNGVRCEFTPGQMILQAANAQGVAVPQYCYHDGLSIVASCRICLGEVWAPNPRANNQLEPYMGGKLLPTCQTQAMDGMVVYTDSPKAVANQKAVMEYLLINHPLDCPVCDQAGECFLQDYSYEYGRGVSRFQEQKVKQPKKDLGPHVYLYADRCIMCTRCVRFTREVSGTSELIVQGRGNKSEIDVFPGVPIDNELSANVIDLCPVGALLDKDFLFAQRVWFLRSTPSIDGVTASGDNITVEHNEGRVYRIKPRPNMAVNKWWITDEVRYGWKHVHSDARLSGPMFRNFDRLTPCDWSRALETAGVSLAKGGRLALVLSPMLSCEDAYLLITLAIEIDPNADVVIGPVPVVGKDKVFPKGSDEGDPKAFVSRAEKAPNARGVRRVARALLKRIPREWADVRGVLGNAKTAIVTGNYPSDWGTPELAASLSGVRDRGGLIVLIDALTSSLVDLADVVLPSSTWVEKAGSFENIKGVLQAFEQAIPPVGQSKGEGQIALDLIAEVREARGQEDQRGVSPARVVVVDEQPGAVPAAVMVQGARGRIFNAEDVRREMAQGHPELSVFVSGVSRPAVAVEQASDVQMVEL